MKVGIFQDIHANLPALECALEFFESNNCELIYHVGDLIGIGPHPKEVVELARTIESMKFIMGNHDHWYAFGIPIPIPSYMNADEFAHHKWVHDQLGNGHIEFFQSWKFSEELQLVNDKVIFEHYALIDTKQWFKQHIKYPIASQLDKHFEYLEGTTIFYGHNHLASDIVGRNHYVNLGSAGCFEKAEARIAILDSTGDKNEITKFSIPYDDSGLIEAYEERKVPAREFILKAFINR